MRFLNEDPWERLRQLRKHMPNTKLQMLLRGQNLLGYKHYADDVVEAFCAKSIENGIDVSPRVRRAERYPQHRERGQGAPKSTAAGARLPSATPSAPCITRSTSSSWPRSWSRWARTASASRTWRTCCCPIDAYNLVKKLKQSVKVPIHLHTHNTTGTGDMVYLMAAQAGVDIVDTALSPMANGTSQPATESMVATFKGTEFDTGLDMDKLLQGADSFPQGG